MIVTIVSKGNLTFNKANPFSVENHKLTISVDGDLIFTGTGGFEGNLVLDNSTIDIKAKNIVFKDLNDFAIKVPSRKLKHGVTINLTADTISKTGPGLIVDAYQTPMVNINLTGNMQINCISNVPLFKLEGINEGEIAPSSLTMKYSGDSEFIRPSENGVEVALIRASTNSTVKIVPTDENSSLHMQGVIDSYKSTPDIYINLGKKGSWKGGGIGKASSIKLDLGNDGSFFVGDNAMGEVIIVGGKGTITNTVNESFSATCIIDMQRREGININLIPQRRVKRQLVTAYKNVPVSAGINIDLSQWGELKEQEKIPLAYFDDSIASLLDGKVIRDSKNGYTHFYEDLTTVQKTNEKNQKDPDLSLLVVSLEKHKATPLIDYSAQFGKEGL